MKIYNDIEQGTPEWFEVRRGIITASEVKHVMTPTGKPSNNDKTRLHAFELFSQRLSGFVEPTYESDDMVRGTVSEIKARDLYDFNYDFVEQVGFVTNDKWGFTIGCSPDGLVGTDGSIEIKSPRQKHHIKTVCDGGYPLEHKRQIQTVLMVTERKWCDFISYCPGHVFYVYRVHEDLEFQEKIIDACREFYNSIDELDLIYKQNSKGMFLTDNEVSEEIEVI